MSSCQKCNFFFVCVCFASIMTGFLDIILYTFPHFLHLSQTLYMQVGYNQYSWSTSEIHFKSNMKTCYNNLTK